MPISEEAKKARSLYQKKWREENREKYNKYQREWRKSHPDRVQRYNEVHWEKQAQKIGGEPFGKIH